MRGISKYFVLGGLLFSVAFVLLRCIQFPKYTVYVIRDVFHANGDRDLAKTIYIVLKNGNRAKVFFDKTILILKENNDVYVTEETDIAAHWDFKYNDVGCVIVKN